MISFISAPRCGSTWVFEYIKNFNIQKHSALTFPQDEFLNRDFNVWLKRNNIYKDEWKDLDSKLKFLEENPRYTYKTHVNHVKDQKERYLNLIKGNHIIILKRRDTWRAFLSFLVRKHLAVNNLPTNIVHQYKYKDFPDVKIELKPIVDNWFLDNLKLLDGYCGEVLYYEDLCDHELEHTFGVKAKSVMKNEVDYEKYITDLDFVRSFYLSQSQS
tara:strand:+ start:894 stop:1538 length:645 start_codon:yes stop_codon:yes gene_type:complete